MIQEAPAKPIRKARILVVDDDPAMLRLLEQQLSSAGHEVLKACNGHEAMQVILERGPQVVITDWMMPRMDGIELCRAVRETGICGFVYFIVLTAMSERDRLVEAFDAGADDFLRKPVHKAELLSRLKAGLRIVQLESDLAGKHLALHRANAELAVLNDKLDRQATTDDLTGLLNRREALRRLHGQWALAQRHGQPLACVMLDIDDFKRVNDTHGHTIGDAVLCHVARVLQSNTRGGEPICRLGGEEFLLICPTTTLDEATHAAERLRSAVACSPFRREDITLRLTISAGVSACGPNLTQPDEMIRYADQALYDAKHQGRNRVCLAQTALPVSPSPPDASE